MLIFKVSQIRCQILAYIFQHVMGELVQSFCLSDTEQYFHLTAYRYSAAVVIFQALRAL